MFFDLIHCFAKNHAQRVGFFTGGAARNPETDRRIRLFFAQQLRQHLLRKHIIGFRIPEEAGYPDDQVFKEHVYFGRIFLEIKNVIGQPFYLVDRQAAFNPPRNGVRFVMGKIVAGFAADQRKNLLYLVFNRRCCEFDFIQ